VSWFRPTLPLAPSPIQTRLRQFSHLGVPNRSRAIPRGYAQPVRVLVVTNFVPDAGAPQRGRWIRDQVEEIRRRGVEVEVFSFPPGSRQYIPATRRLRRRLREDDAFDLVHAHYGLPGWCARLAGASPLVVSFHGTDVRHPVVGRMSRRLIRRIDLAAVVSGALFLEESGRPGLPLMHGAAVLPCGPDLARFGPLPREQARRELGLSPEGRYLLFPANPDRPEKRADRARELAGACDAELLVGGAIEPEQMRLWINAADAVLVTSDYEGLGMVCIEALACEVPVLSTPVGIAPFLLEGIDGALCAPFELAAWRSAALAHLDSSDPRIAGAGRARQLSSARTAERTIEAYRDVLASS
jgi:glycosyltransferase involved in cell wall biosynthesis